MQLIDADSFAEQYGNYYAEEGPEEGFIGTVGELIAQQPTIEAKPVRHGRWVIINTDANVWECTTCGEEWMLNDGNPSDNNMLFCPHCGSRMCGGYDND